MKLDLDKCETKVKAYLALAEATSTPEMSKQDLLRLNETLEHVRGVIDTIKNWRTRFDFHNVSNLKEYFKKK